MTARGFEISAIAATTAGFVCSVAAMAALVGAAAGHAEPHVSAERVSAAAVLRAEHADRQFDTSIASLAVAAPTVAEFQQIAAVRAIESRTGRLPESEQAIQAALARAMKLGTPPSSSNATVGAGTAILALNLASIVLVALAFAARRRERARIVARLDMPADSVTTGDFANAFFLCLVQKGGLTAERHGTLPMSPLRLSSSPDVIDCHSHFSPGPARRTNAIDDLNDGIGPTGVRASR
jgi:hypothetical protein